jgi:SAM-dependent methyltransferase
MYQPGQSGSRGWITCKYPKFRFQQVTAHNQMYSPRIKRKADKYRFPFLDQSFDFVFSNSLFTHLLPEATINYFCEISRVLKSDGRTLNSVFLLNQHSRALLDAGICPVSLPNHMAVCRTKDAVMPEAFVAYEEGFLVKVHQEAGLQLLGPIRYGAWCGRSSQDEGFGGKDLVTAIKVKSAPDRHEADDGNLLARLRHRLLGPHR